MAEKILLLSCCAPCSCAVIKTMAEEGREFAVVFYNPNIRPLAEYEKRRDENARIWRCIVSSNSIIAVLDCQTPLP